MIQGLVTGGNSQLAKAFKRLAPADYVYASREELDINDQEQVDAWFEKTNPRFLINCAAFTNVDGAEDDPIKAFEVNAHGVEKLAKACTQYNTILVHISTDYVFDGTKGDSYREQDYPNPINEYGKSKLSGEEAVHSYCKQHYIVRTSWLYSQDEGNFLHMIRNTSQDLLNIVDNQIGCPTSTDALARYILWLLDYGRASFGTYHFSSSDSCSWYAFAKACKQKLNLPVEIEPTDHFPTKATRPAFSVLNTAKVASLGYEVPDLEGVLDEVCKSILKPTEVELRIDGTTHHFEVQGSFNTGVDEVIYDESRNPIRNADWKDRGYASLAIMDEDRLQSLQEQVLQHVQRALAAAGVASPLMDLSQYHRVVDDATHAQVISILRETTATDLNLDLKEVARTLGTELCVDLTDHIEQLGESYVQIRISRPRSLDINPPHRDAYLDYWKNIVNVWMPIAGCNAGSILPVAPGSHHWNEKDIKRTQARAAYINGNRYHVPCILSHQDQSLNLVRPTIVDGQALVFTPYLIHGAAINENADATRVALELRFAQDEA